MFNTLWVTRVFYVSEFSCANTYGIRKSVELRMYVIPALRVYHTMQKRKTCLRVKVTL